MLLLLIEALGALIVLSLIVWWTMFSGRHGGELEKKPGSGDRPGGATDDHPD